MKIAVLAGGTGGAKLAAGFATLLTPAELAIVANTADDDEFWGLWVCPDVDAMLYRFGGMFNERSGFGVADDTFNALSMLHRLGEPTWFALGDQDIGLHLLRTTLMRRGMRLTTAVAEIARRLGIPVTVLPMSDDRVQTRVLTDDGELSMQQWFVERNCAPGVRSVRYQGIEAARATPEVVEAVDGADAVVIGPSNPLLSIDPILALLAGHLDPRRVIVVSPIVGGRSLKGPTVEMLRDLGEDPTSVGVAKHYAGSAATVIVDTVDAPLRTNITPLGMNAVALDTVMSSAEQGSRLAGEILRLVEHGVLDGGS